MIKIKVIAIGRIKEKWLQEAQSEYQKRLFPHIQIEWIRPKNDKELLSLTKNEPYFIALDPNGIAYDSLSWTGQLYNSIEKNGSRITFVIGGAEGLPIDVKRAATALWSLSPLTFTHQLTQLILLEQIYRASEIVKNSPYHK